MMKTVLRQNPSKDDDSWVFEVPPTAIKLPNNPRHVHGKMVIFTGQEIALQIERFSENRVLRADDPSKFILASFGNLRFEDATLRDTQNYITHLMQKGLFLNGVQYRFYHHSNSQLRGRSCYLRQADTDEELDERIYAMGDFGRIMNVAKRAKRIGLLFSEAQLDWQLDPRYVADIPDIQLGDEIFSDGCGLISRRLAVQVSKAKKIIFRGARYTPTVFQIRYRGYKGVLMLHPQLDVEGKHLAEFRKSMKKFTATSDNTFSVVNYSKPYSYGRLNNDVIVLLSSLGISDDKLLEKQRQYFDWISDATKNPVKAIDFLSCHGEYSLAERVLLDGIENQDVVKGIQKLQRAEIAGFKNDRGKGKSRIFVRQSRRLFGVCDPFQVLKEGEVHIRIVTGRQGPSTPIHGDVLVVRNPCLHPGDCLKLRAVHNDKLVHLVDCIVFASVARPGHHAAPSMSSGGDLDGDEYFVCWDFDLVPSKVMQSYDYPPNPERVNRKIKRSDLAAHFAAYSGAGVARIAALHAKWVRSSPFGALSTECQELNALHSQCVDGASIKIPDRLRTPPEEPGRRYIVDLLEEEAVKFVERFLDPESLRDIVPSLDSSDAESFLVQLMQSQEGAVSEYELFNLACLFARKHKIDIKPFLGHLDMGALTTREKYAMDFALDLPPQDYPYIWNSLLRSDILTPRDIYQRDLNHPFSLQRLYSSRIHGLYTFFEYLRMATQDYTRKLLILKMDDRFSVGIFMKGQIPWNEDPEVNDNVIVCSFMPQTASMASQSRCTPGYRLHCSDSTFQLYNKNIGDTFVFINRPPAASGASVATSIALQKISQNVLRNVGRINKTPVVAIEIHVVSNRDRVAHQLFDLWFDHVPTEEYIKRFDRRAMPYLSNDVRDVDWSLHPEWIKSIFNPGDTVQDSWPALSRPQPQNPSTLSEETLTNILPRRTMIEIDDIMKFALKYHNEDVLFMVFNYVISQQSPDIGFIKMWIKNSPALVYAFLKKYPPDDSGYLSDDFKPLIFDVLQNIIRSANTTGIAALVAVEKLSGSIVDLPAIEYFELLMLAALSVRSQSLVQEVLLVLNDCRMPVIQMSASERYGCKHALAIAFDRAEEAADECPCNDEGKPRRQRVSPTQVKLSFVPEHPMQVRAVVRVDARSPVRLHSHVRLQAVSKATNRWTESVVLDGLVILALKGELTIELLHPPPPELELMDWNMYHAGIIATSRAMMDAVSRLMQEGLGCCAFSDIIMSSRNEPTTEEFAIDAISIPSGSTMNESQLRAVQSSEAPLALIWGPPGTGKTTVVIEILERILCSSDPPPKILMTASTHNAVDNVLERFIRRNGAKNLVPVQKILRVATDQSKVNRELQDYTVNARVGGDVNENNRLIKEAQRRVNEAAIVFTTCAGAGLGILRKVDFDIAIIDEASQITEPCALIPLVKGIKRAVLVGDHVQLRPTVRRMGKALEFDVSLLEHLYRHGNASEMRKTMLDVQYRFSEALNGFPSHEFYEGKLQTGIPSRPESLRVLSEMLFPWPVRDGAIFPVVFIPCSTEEDMGGMSKSNEGQIGVIKQILPMLTQRKEALPSQMSEGSDDLSALKITILSPYTKQIQMLRSRLSIPCSTVDAFQGRESDIIIFSTVRSNAERDVGFLEDARRLNVMWTRAKLALIIIGDGATLKENPLWKRALEACAEVRIDVPVGDNT